MLTELARANSVKAFYRGDIAQRIADGFQKNGGLVTAQNMAAYRARLIEPLKMTWGRQSIHTAPLTAGGLSVLQMLLTLQAMNWDKLPAGLLKTHARVEAMRLAWRDRLTLLGDPEFSDVPVTRLMSEDYARESADRIMAAVKDGKPLAHAVTPRPHTGTIHLSAADRHGNFAALTLTHGNTFGACVTVVVLGQPIKESIAASRLHTEGDTTLSVEKAWPVEDTTALRNLGYTFTTSGSATMSAVAVENGGLQQAGR